jgi:hypothetical protein
MNGDGLPDAVLHEQNGVPLVFLSRVDGWFTAVPNSSLPAAPGFNVTADFNGDGKIDVVSITPGSVLIPLTNAALSVFLGNGDGTLSFKGPALDFAFPHVISAAIAGDFNGDRKQDLILLGNASTTGASLLLGNGDGTFQTPQPTTLLNDYPVTIATADLNGDGILDLVIGDSALGTAAYLGNGEGTFRPLSRIFPFVPSAIIATDVTGDGKPDLVVLAAPFATGSDLTLEVYTGNGDGTFSANPTFAQTYTNGYTAISIGDVNGDGLPDIAASGSVLSVFLNQGGGSFTLDTTEYYEGYALTGTPIALERLNSNNPSAGPNQTLDALVYTSGGLTSLLNQLNPAPKPVPTVSVSLADGVTSVTTGTTVTINATLSSVGATPPTGTVAFFAGATQIGTVTVTGGGASLTAPVAGSGVVLIRAVYSGDSTYGAATGYTSLTLTAPAVTTTTLTASAVSLDEQQKVTLTATVQGNAPSGTVTFLNGATNLGTATLSGGSASLTTSFANAGSVSVTASYAGDENNLSSVSSPVTVTVVAPSFAVAVSPSSATISAGQSATFTITVTPAGGFASAVGLSCGALPSESSCVFSSQSVTPSNGQPAQAKLTISSSASSADLQHNMHGLPGRDPWLPGGAIMSLAGLLGFLRNRAVRRRYHCWLRAMSLWIIICGVGMFLIGCGGNSTPTNSGTPVGTSNITISASVAGGTSTQTASIQLIVQ